MRQDLAVVPPMSKQKHLGRVEQAAVILRGITGRGRSRLDDAHGIRRRFRPRVTPPEESMMNSLPRKPSAARRSRNPPQIVS